MSIDLNNLLTSDLKIDPDSFSNQVVVITGAGQGIGFYTARAFALLGARVILAELSENGQAAEAAIRSEGGTALFIQTDVSNQDSVAHLQEEVHKAYGPVNVLINNAIYIQASKVLDMNLETWDHTIAVNLRGTFLTCRAFLPEMLRSNRGVIVNMISTDAMPGLAAYIASKKAVTGFSQSLAQELDQTNVLVVPFAPGMVDTPGIRSVAGDLAPELGLTESQFLNLSLHANYDGLMPPEHAAAATIYLVAYLANEFNGQIVNGYEILERSGILITTPNSLPELHNPSIIVEETAHELYNKIFQILDETEKEFKKLPVFVRPMAKSGFKSKTGMSLSDWQRLVSDLASGVIPIPNQMGEKLAALAVYYREVPMETARFTKDEETLQMVAETAQLREEVIHKLTSRIT